jgi:4-diphosphocytidyl-2-C-methyl-D-erythritol kinase
VSSLLVETAPAKINLTLRVIGRRDDGYHELESVVGFAGVADSLDLATAGKPELEISGPFAAACGPVDDNLVLKAARALNERMGGLKTGRFRLEKNLPVAAGIGGGSADAAAALRLLARANDMAPDDPRLVAAAGVTGADVPVCLHPRARVMRGIGDLLSGPVMIPRLDVVLANPGVPLSSRDVFACFAGGGASRTTVGQIPVRFDALISFLDGHGNDLTEAAIACSPAVSDLLAALRALPGNRLTRMSGSGPTCFAVFASAAEASEAARLLAAANRSWWIRATTIG